MKHLVITAAICAATASPALADVKAASETGFNVIHIATVQATPDEIWQRLVTPKGYWNKSHSWSGSTDGFYIDAQANGCFCELFQETDANGKVKTVGSVEHMRVIFAKPGKVLRMQGALGPLQSEAVIGTLTVAMEPAKEDGGTRVSFSYVVGGYMRYKVAEIAPAVDKMLGEQFKNMLRPFTSPADEPPKVDGFNLDVENLDMGTATEAADPNEAKAEAETQGDPLADPPAAEPI